MHSKNPDFMSHQSSGPAEPSSPQTSPEAGRIAPPPPTRLRRASSRFMWADPAHVVAMGFGSGLSPVAPGTVGTLWGWGSWVLLTLVLQDHALGLLCLAAFPLGWWASTRTARHLGISDPSAVVWDEIAAFWLILWVMGHPKWQLQLLAFLLFRLFDAAKPGPVGWADQLFKAPSGQAPGWRQGLGILIDDYVAAAMTLLCLALLAQVSARTGLLAAWFA